MQIFETTDDFLNHGEESYLRHLWVSINKLLHGNRNPWVQFGSFVKQVDKVFVKLCYTLAKVENIVSADSLLIFVQLHHLIDHLRNLIFLVSFEHNIACHNIFEAHPIDRDIHGYVSCVTPFFLSLFDHSFAHIFLLLLRNAGGESAKDSLGYDIRHLRPQDFYPEHVFVY